MERDRCAKRARQRPDGLLGYSWRVRNGSAPLQYSTCLVSCVLAAYQVHAPCPVLTAPESHLQIRGVRDPSKYYSDGGTKMGVDVFNTVVRCRGLGYADNDIVVDTLLTAGLQPLQAVNTANFNYRLLNR